MCGLRDWAWRRRPGLDGMCRLPAMADVKSSPGSAAAAAGAGETAADPAATSGSSTNADAVGR